MFSDIKVSEIVTGQRKSAIEQGIFFLPRAPRPLEECAARPKLGGQASCLELSCIFPTHEQPAKTQFSG
jgi:hypothetical protein